MSKLLNEIVNVDYITNAIENRFVVNIYYAGDDTVNKGYRDIEIHKYGLTKKGNEAISAWQRSGASDTPEDRPGWRLFIIDNIKNWVVKNERFDKPRIGYNPTNKSDGVLSKIFMTLDDSEPIKKPEKEPETQTVNISKPDNKKSEPIYNKDKEKDDESNLDYDDEFGTLYEIKNELKKLIQ